MTHRPDLDPNDEILLLDALQGELDPAAAEVLEERLAAEPDLVLARDAWAALLASEREAFEPAGRRAALEADAGHIAARIQAEVRAWESAPSRSRAAHTPVRGGGWAQVLAWSVAIHVVALGAIALIMDSPDEPVAQRDSTSIDFDRGATWGAVAVDDDPADYLGARLYREIALSDLEPGPELDRAAMVESDTLLDELGDDFGRALRDRPVAWDGLAFPVDVMVPMTRRRTDRLKRRRLDLLGFNSQGTLRAVDNGLRHLARRQAADGSYGAGGNRDDVAQTALTLLAFLGEGHTSRGRSERDEVVARGVHWLRGRVFEGDPAKASTAVGAPRLKKDSASVLGPATVAMSEDYMLSYGDLPPRAAARRSEEIAVLARRIRATLERRADHLDAVAGADRTWLIWALDAATRAGVVPPRPGDQKVFAAWVEAAATAAGTAADAMQALSGGTALLYAERGAQKPRFLTWSQANAESLLARLDPRGVVRNGDEIGDTAMILLALQVAYRTY